MIIRTNVSLNVPCIAKQALQQTLDVKGKKEKKNF